MRTIKEFRKNIIGFNKSLRPKGYYLKMRKIDDEPGYYNIFMIRYVPKMLPLQAAKIKIYLDREDDGEIILDRGRTFLKFRKQNLGTILRAIVVWSAKKSGFAKASQTSTNLNKTRPGKRPLSALIMNKLGFSINKVHTNLSENRSLNLTRNTPKLNNILREYIH